MGKVEENKHLVDRNWYIQSFNGTPVLIHLAGMSATMDLQEVLGYSYRAFIMDFRQDFLEAYYDKDDFHTIAHAFEDRLEKDPDYFDKLIAKSEERKELLFSRAHEFIPRLATMSKEDLIATYKEFSKTLYALISESHMIESYALTRDTKLKALLIETLEKQGNGKQFIHYFTTLTQPIRKPFIVEYNNALATVVQEIKKDTKLFDQFSALSGEELEPVIEGNAVLSVYFSTLEKDFYWVQASYVNAVRLKKFDFIPEVKRALAEKELAIVPDSTIQNNIDEKKKSLEIIDASHELRTIINTTDIMAYWQDDRKKYILQGLGFIEEFLKEMAQRFGKEKHHLKYVIPEELSVEKLEKMNTAFFEERMKGTITLYEGKNVTVLSGKEYQEYHELLKTHKQGDVVGEIEGMCASIGKVAGTVHICKTLAEINNFKAGEILVTGMTRPEFVPAMRKAAAIVTDEGGITSHAAIISRELGVPCVIGTKIATRELKNGDFVEVNANHGVVKRIVSE
jgi:phosphohistidine swiveling domain-containing protein